MFDAYLIESETTRARARRRDAGEWLVELATGAHPTRVQLGDPAPVIEGDPSDSLPLGLTSRRWGLPNPWMARVGLDPLDGALPFAKLSDPPPRPDGESGPYWRCLVPITGLVIRVDGAETRWRDPDRPILTLAGLIGSVVRADSADFGFGLLTAPVREGAARQELPLVVSEQHHEEWMCGWYGLAEVSRCCAPLLLPI